MAPSQVVKPKRKRQRKRALSESSSSSSSGSSSEDEVVAIAQPIIKVEKLIQSSSEESSSESESSEDERSKRKGRGKKGKGIQVVENKINISKSAVTVESSARRPYPERSPSPIPFNQLNIPLGLNIFPLYTPASLASTSLPIPSTSTQSPAATATIDDKQVKFGEWYRERLVTEFSTELGSLASEPNLTAPRLDLLLTSLTTLSSLHTTSSSTAKQARSIWLHDPTAPIDPLAKLELSENDFGKGLVGGDGDVEVGTEGMDMDSKREAKEGKVEMEIDG